MIVRKLFYPLGRSATATGAVDGCSDEPAALRNRVEAFVCEHNLAIRPD